MIVRAHESFATRDSRVFARVARRTAAALTALLLTAALAHPGRSQSAADTRPNLGAAIDAIVDSPEYGAARFGVFVVALDTGETLYARDAKRLFQPASNMKLYSTALALDQLGPEYRWKTSVYSTARPDSKGTVRDLVLYGRGDPTICARFSEGDALKKVELLADRIVAAGVRRVAGDIVADESYFAGERFGFGWEWNDLQWDYGAEVSAMSFADNVVEISVTPASRPGTPCKVTLAPYAQSVRVLNRTQTSPKGGVSDLGIYRAQASNVVEVWGHLPVGGTPFADALAVHDPAALFAHVLREALVRRKVVISGRVRSVDGRARRDAPFVPADAIELASLESEPLADVVRATNKVSQNLYAELLLRTVGRVKGASTAASSEDAGLGVLTGLLKAGGADVTPLVFSDGSGLSRRTLVTPESTARLLVYARRQPWGDLFLDSLPIGGRDGTLARRFADTLAAGRVHAKTGTLESVSTLSGYLTTVSGRPVAFSVMANNQPSALPPLRRAIDAVVNVLVDR
jgi:serine-type D-Ala-D-Ala carboxypeptidase/endopeptidase (penicillin-binding protein 4)